MSMIAAFAAITHAVRKKEDTLAPFKRTAELADKEQDKAFSDLEIAVKELTKIVEGKSK